MDIWHWSLELCKQIQHHSNLTDTIKNSSFNSWLSILHYQHDNTPWSPYPNSPRNKRSRKHHQKLESRTNSLLPPLTPETVNRKLTRRWPIDLRWNERIYLTGLKSHQALYRAKFWLLFNVSKIWGIINAFIIF